MACGQPSLKLIPDPGLVWTNMAHAHYPARAPIDADGNGGFRFAGMSHRGSIRVCRAGYEPGDPLTMAQVTLEALAPAMAERNAMDLLLLGTGAAQVFPARELRHSFQLAGIALEAMATGAAARTYNVLLAEGRQVGAALLAVE